MKKKGGWEGEVLTIDEQSIKSSAERGKLGGLDPKEGQGSGKCGRGEERVEEIKGQTEQRSELRGYR